MNRDLAVFFSGLAAMGMVAIVFWIVQSIPLDAG